MSVLELCRLFNRELKQAMFSNHGPKPEFNIPHARTVVSHRFSNQLSLPVKRYFKYRHGSVKTSQIGKQLTSGCLP